MGSRGRCIPWVGRVRFQRSEVRRGHKTTQSVNNSANVNTALDIPPSSGGLVGMERRLVQNIGDLGLGQRTAEEVTEVAFDG